MIEIKPILVDGEWLCSGNGCPQWDLPIEKKPDPYCFLAAEKDAVCAPKMREIIKEQAARIEELEAIVRGM